MTTDELRAVQAAYEAAQRSTGRYRAMRNELIRRALDEGWTHARIAEAMDLSRGRIGQLAQSDGGTHA